MAQERDMTLQERDRQLVKRGALHRLSLDEYGLSLARAHAHALSGALSCWCFSSHALAFHTYRHAHTCIHQHTHIHHHIHSYKDIHTKTRTCTFPTHVGQHMHTYTNTNTHTHTHTHRLLKSKERSLCRTFIRAYTYTHTHTHTHTHRKTER